MPETGPRASPPSATELRELFDRAPPYTLGLEEEVMLLDPSTYELAPRAQEVLDRLDGDPRFKLELPASQLEVALPPMEGPSGVPEALLDARRTLAGAAEGLVRPAAAAVHPFSCGVGELHRTPRYAGIVREYGAIATRQLVCALQVHVSVGDSGRALTVYNMLRGYLPLLAALAANGPFYEGADTGLASVRPKLCELLPRQGVPPAIPSWEAYSEMLGWGAVAGAFPEPRAWWWELRLHPGFGTLELRVPDAQSTVADAAAVVTVIHALVKWLGARCDAGEQAVIVPRWRIEENRWSACRYGVQGTMADLVTGEPRPTATRLHELLETLGQGVDSPPLQRALDHAAGMVSENGALAQRRAALAGDVTSVAPWLADRFLS
jgi:carboxylate-amine ligase